MRTLLFKVLSAFFAVFILTSCLGGGDSYQEVSKDFAYIKTVKLNDIQSIKCAITESAGAVRSDKIDALTEGRAYYVSYKVTLSNGAYSTAERFDLVSNDPIHQAMSMIGKPYDGVPSIQLPDSIHPKNVSIGTNHPYESVIDDNWLIKYNVRKKEGDKVQAYFYYDENAQNENGNPLEQNQVIIDIRFVKTDKSTEAAEEKDESLEAIGSLNQLRKMYQPKYASGVNYADVLMKFRYVRYPDSTGELPKISYIGTFYVTGGQPLYFMRFFKEE